MTDFRKENYSDEFLDDLENGLNHIDSIHTSIDDVCIEEVTKRKDDIECHNIKLVNGDDVFSKIDYNLNRSNCN